MIHINSNSLKNNIFLISELFHENTKDRLFYPSSIEIDDPQILKVLSRSYKTYRNAKKVKLPGKFRNSEVSVEKAIGNRRSIRDFSGEPISLHELSKLLFYANGITGSLQYDDVTLLLRAAPSAGALYPIEVYVTIFNVRDLEAGIYHYNVKDHELELMRQGDYRSLLFNCIHKQEMMLHASAMFLFTGIFARTRVKYGERGYRYVLFEAGHIAQNIYMMTIAMNIGVVTIGGFLDDPVNELLGIDGVNEAALYLAVVGKKLQGL